jgi:TolB-like protein
LIGGIGASVYLLTRGGNRSDSRTLPEEAKAVEAIAVLPFENVGGDPEAEHLSDGIPESIIKRIAGQKMYHKVATSHVWRGL